MIRDGDLLEAALTHSGLSASDFARDIGRDPRVLRKWRENGRAGTLRLTAQVRNMLLDRLPKTLIRSLEQPS